MDEVEPTQPNPTAALDFLKAAQGCDPNDRPALLFDWWDGKRLTDDDLRRVITEVWQKAESPEPALGELTWVKMFRVTGFVCDDLGRGQPNEPLRVYRGTTWARRRGMAWTLTKRRGSPDVGTCGEQDTPSYSRPPSTRPRFSLGSACPTARTNPKWSSIRHSCRHSRDPRSERLTESATNQEPSPRKPLSTAVGDVRSVRREVLSFEWRDGQAGGLETDRVLVVASVGLAKRARPVRVR